MELPLQQLLSATIPVQSFHPHYPVSCVTETHSISTSINPQPLTLVSSTILRSLSYSITSQVIAVTKARGRCKVLDSAHALSIHSSLKVVAVTPIIIREHYLYLLEPAHLQAGCSASFPIIRNQRRSPSITQPRAVTRTYEPYLYRPENRKPMNHRAVVTDKEKGS